MKRVVIFDTGTGGGIFAEHFRKELEDTEIIEVTDAEHAPYGGRSGWEIVQLTEMALSEYLDKVDIIVLACNTATVPAIETLRKKYPNQAFVGTEPGIKPAVELSKTGTIVVLATPATLGSDRYRELCDGGRGINICEADCADWAKKIDEGWLTQDDIRKALSPFEGENPDVVVLACTHYLAIPMEWIESVLPGATIYSPLEAITSRVRELLRQK